MSYDDNLVTIGTYSTVSDAYIFKNILTNAGIESIVVDSNAPLTPAVPDIHNGGVLLSVRAADAENAINILKGREYNHTKVEDIDHLLL